MDAPVYGLAIRLGCIQHRSGFLFGWLGSVFPGFDRIAEFEPFIAAATESAALHGIREIDGAGTFQARGVFHRPEAQAVAVRYGIINDHGLLSIWRAASSCALVGSLPLPALFNQSSAPYPIRQQHTITFYFPT